MNSTESVPDISVLMAVYNGRADIARTLDSILQQRDVSFELIVVDDGSTDGSGEILDSYVARDPRVRVLRQENQGLTRALANGAAHVRGRFILRHDVGDVSHSDRFAKQLACANANPDAAIVSCGTRFVGPLGELLYEVVRDPNGADDRLRTTDPDLVEGPSSHPSTLFPRELYHAVGGYRREFYVAQDLDLWMRLAERGRHVVMPEVLYETTVGPGSISATHRTLQRTMLELLVQCAERRRQGLSESDLLNVARGMRKQRTRTPKRLNNARAFYFIGECLRRRKDARCKTYFRRALMEFPLHGRSLIRLVQSASLRQRQHAAASARRGESA